MTRAGLKALREMVALAAKMLLIPEWPRPRLRWRGGIVWTEQPPLKRGQKRRRR